MDCEQLMDVINETAAVNVDKKIKKYIADIAETSRNHQFVKLGLSPRGAIAVSYTHLIFPRGFLTLT